MGITGRGLTKAGRLFDRLLDLFAVLAGLIVSFVTISVCLGIISRYVFNRPIVWVVEICEYSLLYITFLVAAWVLRQEQHVSLDLVFCRLSAKRQAITSMITSLIAGITFLIITFYGLKVTKSQFDTKYFTPTVLEFPKFAITLIIPVGGFLLLIQIIRKICRHMNELTRGDFSKFREKEGESGLQAEP